MYQKNPSKVIHKCCKFVDCWWYKSIIYSIQIGEHVAPNKHSSQFAPISFVPIHIYLYIWILSNFSCIFFIDHLILFLCFLFCFVHFFLSFCVMMRNHFIEFVYINRCNSHLFDGDSMILCCHCRVCFSLFRVGTSCENRFSCIPFTYKCNRHFTCHIFNCCHYSTIRWKSNRLRTYEVSSKRVEILPSWQQ